MFKSFTTIESQEIDPNLRSQAKVRAKVGLPVIVIGLITVQIMGSSFGRMGHIAVSVIALVHAIYVLAMLSLTSPGRQRLNARTLVYATAVLDPFILSAWLSLTGEAGGVFVCFYLFTILGFGFRIGSKAMHACQGASMLGFGMVLVIDPFWQQQPLSGLSLFLMLVVVPAYATGLINKLRKAQELAQFESKAKSELLAKVSHELRTPLSGIIASAELMASDTDPSQKTHRAAVILRLGNELLREIDDLLDMAKSGAAALELTPAPFDLNSVMGQVSSTFAPGAEAKGLHFKMTIDPAIKSMVVGDAHYLGRIVKNLVGNAVKFTSFGEINVQLQMLEQGNNYYRVRFSVRDTGIGIPLVLHQQVFEPFFQASFGTTRRFGGTGLGLSLADDIAKLMGCEIVIESEVGVGSRFYFDFTLPTVFITNEHFVGTTLMHIIEGQRILVADDYETNLDLIQELLEKDNHRVAVARSGEEALGLIADQEFDIIFLDYHMGDMDGGQVLQAYQFGKIDRAPVFFLTADTTLGTKAKLMAMGAAGVLHKPVTGDALRKAIAFVSTTTDVKAVPAPEVPPPVFRNDQAVKLQSVAPRFLDDAVIDELIKSSDRPEFIVQIVRNAIMDIERISGALKVALLNNDVLKTHDTALALNGIANSIGAVRIAAVASKLIRIDSDDLLSKGLSWEQDLAQAKVQTMGSLRSLLHEYSTT